MKSMKRILAAICMSALGLTTAVAADYPNAPLRIIVPTGAGGSVDSLARVIQRAIQEKNIYPSVVVINQPGAGGTIGTRALRDSAADGYTIGVWNAGIITSKAMGVVDYDHNDFTILGGSGNTQGGLAVLNSSRIKSVDDLIAISKEKPGSVTVATNIGLPVFFTPLAFSRMADIDMKFVQIGGGAKRLASILGGHTDTAQFSISEMLQYSESGLRPLVLFSDERNPELPDTPTAKEFGIDYTNTSPRIWLAPKGMPEDVTVRVRELLQSIFADPEVQAIMTGLSIEYDWIEPGDMKAKLDAISTEVSGLAEFARGMAK